MDKYITTDINETLQKYGIPEEAKQYVAESIQVGENYAYSLTFGLL